MDAGETMVSMRGVVKRFGAHTAVDAVDLDVRRGEKVVICGSSGSGKSTLIGCINGLVRHDAGSIVVDGIEVSHREGTVPSVRERVGMVFQQFNLFSHLSVLDNCTLALRVVKKIASAQASQIALRHLEQMRISEQAAKRPSQLSGGQQQRVAIARALCLQPALMLFDEPTSALDPEMIKEVLDSMRDLAATGMTMIVVTHEMGFARHVADRIVYMEAARIVEQAPPETFFNQPAQQRTREFIDRILGAGRNPAGATT
jgi:polar amino acid transport system ATP-binding protein/general L-amino acid transport system ATP-binding protein